jgi:YVTN family beta-propeller protein
LSTWRGALLGRADDVAFIDTATRKVERYVPVGSDPSAVVLSGDEKRLYVANRMSDDVSVVDVPSGRVIKVVLVGRAPYSVQFDN